MLSALLTVLAASFVGSLHCAAMCGGLVSFTCGSSDRPTLAQLAYHGSRLIAYSSLGGLAGYLGQSLNRRFDVSEYQNVAGLVAGLAMVGWALLSLVRRWRASRAGSAPKPLLSLSSRKPRASVMSSWLGRVHALPSTFRGALMGLTSAVLPCGWLYTFVAAAAGRGDAGEGALLMSAFWLGTLPMLVGLGGLVQLLSDRLRRYLPQVSTLVLLALGLGTLALRQPRANSLDTSHQDSSRTHSCH